MYDCQNLAFLFGDSLYPIMARWFLNILLLLFVFFQQENYVVRCKREERFVVVISTFAFKLLLLVSAKISSWFFVNIFFTGFFFFSVSQYTFFVPWLQRLKINIFICGRLSYKWNMIWTISKTEEKKSCSRKHIACEFRGWKTVS